MSWRAALGQYLPHRVFWQVLAVGAAYIAHEELLRRCVLSAGLNNDRATQTVLQRACGRGVCTAVWAHLQVNQQRAQRLAEVLSDIQMQVVNPTLHLRIWEQPWHDPQKMLVQEKIILLAGRMDVLTATYLFLEMIGGKEQQTHDARASVACKVDFLSRHTIDPLRPLTEVTSWQRQRLHLPELPEKKTAPLMIAMCGCNA